MYMMEPVIKVVIRQHDFTPVGDLTKTEVRWLIDHMDWIVESVEDGFVTIAFYIPVTR